MCLFLLPENSSSGARTRKPASEPPPTTQGGEEQPVASHLADDACARAPQVFFGCS